MSSPARNGGKTNPPRIAMGVNQDRNLFPLMTQMDADGGGIHNHGRDGIYGKSGPIGGCAFPSCPICVICGQPLPSTPTVDAVPAGRTQVRT
jgi:hypothetical protein